MIPGNREATEIVLLYTDWPWNPIYGNRETIPRNREMIPRNQETIPGNRGNNFQETIWDPWTSLDKLSGKIVLIYTGWPGKPIFRNRETIPRNQETIPRTGEY